MEPDSTKKPLKTQPVIPGEEYEGLRILSRIIAKAIIKDTRRRDASNSRSYNVQTKIN